MIFNFEHYDYSGILETATQKVLWDAEINTVTTRTDPRLQLPRPRVELLFRYEGGRGQYFIAPGTKPEAGFMPDKAHIGRMEMKLITKPNAAEHGQFIGQMRFLMATMATRLTAIFADDLNDEGKPKYYIQWIKAEETDPTWRASEDHYESDLVYTYAFSLNHIYEVQPSLTVLRQNMLCDSDVSAGICNCTDPEPVSAVLGGIRGARYNVVFDIAMVMEGKGYNGGEAVGDYFYIGGNPNTSSFNVARLTVSSPAGTYFLNRDIPNDVQAITYQTPEIPIDGGATVTLQLTSEDNRELRNRFAYAVQGVDGLLPNQGQFVQASLVSQGESGFVRQTVNIEVDLPEVSDLDPEDVPPAAQEEE